MPHLNVTDLSPFDVGEDSRLNPLKRGGMMQSTILVEILCQFHLGLLQGHKLKDLKKL